MTSNPSLCSFAAFLALLAGATPALAQTLTVFGNGTEILSGSTSTASGDFTDFGSVDITASAARAFTLTNAGVAALDLSGTPPDLVTVTGSSAFTVTAQPAASIAASDSSGVTISFAPMTIGLHQATVSIASTDPATPFTFVIEGTGVQPLSRRASIGDSITIDLSALVVPPGQTMRVTGLPPGLVFNPAGPSITGTVLGLVGNAGVEIQFLSGRTVVRRIPFDLAVEPYEFAGSFEVLLEDGATPMGKVKVVITSPTSRVPNPTYSATMERIGQARRTAKNVFTATGSPQTVTVVFPAIAKLDLAELTYQFVLTSGSDVVSGTQSAPASTITARGFRLVRPGRSPFGNPPLTIALSPDQDGDRTSTPGGIGYATGSANSAGLIPIRGLLGDAQAFSASLSLSHTNQAVLWLTPYKNKGSYLGGIIGIGELGVGGRGAPSLGITEGVKWERLPDLTALSYRNGFPPIDLTPITTRWYPVVNADGLAQSLGLQFRGINVFYVAPTFEILPDRLSLRTNFALLRIAPDNSVAFTGKANARAGSFTGNLTLDAPATRSAVSGVLLQDPNLGTLIGQGLIRIPITRTGLPRGSFETAGILLDN